MTDGPDEKGPQEKTGPQEGAGPQEEAGPKEEAGPRNDAAPTAAESPDGPPRLFDPALRRHRRERAARGLGGSADAALFLHREAAAGLADRLSFVTRTFGAAALAGAADGAVGAMLRATGKITELRMAEAVPSLAARAPAGEDVRVGAELSDLAAAPGTLELALSVLELHAENDPVGAMIRARLALKPDGLFLAALFGGDSLMELRACLAQAEADLRGGLSPRVAPMGEVRSWGGLLQRAGFALPVVDSDRLTIWSPSPLHVMRDLRAMGETNCLASQPRGGLRRDLLAHAAGLYQERYGRADGKVRATAEIIYLSGWAPADTQQTPLRPGSARSRLAEALGAQEVSAGEKAGETGGGGEHG